MESREVTEQSNNSAEHHPSADEVRAELTDQPDAPSASGPTRFNIDTQPLLPYAGDPSQRELPPNSDLFDPDNDSHLTDDRSSLDQEIAQPPTNASAADVDPAPPTETHATRSSDGPPKPTSAAAAAAEPPVASQIDTASSADAGRGLPDDAGDNDPLQILLQTSAAAAALQKQFDELKHRRAEILAERDQLSVARNAFERRAKEFAQQVAQERTDQREAQAELEREQTAQQKLRTELEELQQRLERQQDDLATRQERLHEVVDAEMAREREILQRQQQSLDEERQRLIDRTTELEQQHADRLQTVEQTLQTERDGMREAIRSELASEMDEVQRERQEWALYKDKEQYELQQQAEDLQQQREMFGEQLDNEHRRLRDEIEKRRQMLLSEQNNLQRRYRFQFEHLSRARDDFELELRELRKEQKLFRSERSRFDQQHRLQFRQLQRVRATLMQRDASLLREQKVIERLRISTELDLQRQRDRLSEQESAVQQDLEARTRQVRQAEQASAETARKVEQRLQHVNQLRAELDTKQRDILEERLLLEELQAEQTGSARSEPDRLKRAQQTVQTFFLELHDRLQSERNRIQEQAAELADHREQFRRDRLELEQWFAQQEQKLAAAGPEPESATADRRIAELESEISRLRTSWNKDRRESEHRLRELQDELVNAVNHQFNQSGIASHGDDSDDGHMPDANHLPSATAQSDSGQSAHSPDDNRHAA